LSSLEGVDGGRGEFNKLGSHNFTNVESGRQSFFVPLSSLGRLPFASTAAAVVRFDISSNHGNAQFTCVYRITVHVAA
jgi:hypothetical protein